MRVHTYILYIYISMCMYMYAVYFLNTVVITENMYKESLAKLLFHFPAHHASLLHMYVYIFFIICRITTTTITTTIK